MFRLFLFSTNSLPPFVFPSLIFSRFYFFRIFFVSYSSFFALSISTCVCACTRFYNNDILYAIINFYFISTHAVTFFRRGKKFRTVNNRIYAWIDTVSYRIYHREIQDKLQKDRQRQRVVVCVEEGNCMWGRTLSLVAECYSISPSLVSCPPPLPCCVHSLFYLAEGSTLQRGNS